MKCDIVEIGGYQIDTCHVGAVVIGTGCAGYNAADRLHHYGYTDIAVVADDVNAGTSRNTGSDKQTYYKLSLFGSEADSVSQMAQTYFAGQCMDGDHALAEAAGSVKSFLRLCELGVPFPVNRFGEHIGYKTDHDPARRATSIGPLTSRAMTEALERSVSQKGITVFDKHQAISILTDAKGVTGLLCLRTDCLYDKNKRFALFRCANIVMATGGPAGIYADSCFPIGHFGSSGMAYRAGAKGKNMTEWQFGLASVAPRWNVSGTYMQALPRFVSTEPDGSCPVEFLPSYLKDPGKMLTMVFYKGYQWPFDVRKAPDGSSIIDLCVYNEIKRKGRRVFLDFRENPLGRELDFAGLDAEAYAYLEKAGALFGTPYERLRHMNRPAVDFYRGKGVDLKTTPLEIALCAQHNNGGISVDAWWQSDICGLFAVGEAAGSHGVYRPGGSALNAGQVGSDRAAKFIAKKGRRLAEQDSGFAERAKEAVKAAIRVSEDAEQGVSNLDENIKSFSAKMSKAAGAVRGGPAISELLEEVTRTLERFSELVSISDIGQAPGLYRFYDTLTCQQLHLFAMADYLRSGGKSRGSALYVVDNGAKRDGELAELLSFEPDDESLAGWTQEVWLTDRGPYANWRKVRPIPAGDDFFENVWREFRIDENVRQIDE